MKPQSLQSSDAELSLKFCQNSSSDHHTAGIQPFPFAAARPFPLQMLMLSLEAGFSPLASVPGSTAAAAAWPEVADHTFRDSPGDQGVNPHQVLLIVLTALRYDWSAGGGAWGHRFRHIRMHNWHLGYLLRWLKVERKLIYSVFTGLALWPHQPQAWEKAGMTAFYTFSHSSKLTVNFNQFLQAISSSRDFFSAFFFPFRQCFCVCEQHLQQQFGRTENLRLLSSSHTTLPGCCCCCLKGIRCGICSPLSSTHLF